VLISPTDAKAADAADSIDAKAFTCGSAIVFNSGEYNLESPEGQYLLAHELAHVKQQTGTAISMMPQEGAELKIDPDLLSRIHGRVPKPGSLSAGVGCKADRSRN